MADFPHLQRRNPELHAAPAGKRVVHAVRIPLQLQAPHPPECELGRGHRPVLRVLHHFVIKFLDFPFKGSRVGALRSPAGNGNAVVIQKRVRLLELFGEGLQLLLQRRDLGLLLAWGGQGKSSS